MKVYSIFMQRPVQKAVTGLTEAVISRDKIRASLGNSRKQPELADRGRQIRSENLMAAESRINDLDIATEMIDFVRSHVLSQSSVGLLTQSHALPGMALQLIH